MQIYEKILPWQQDLQLYVKLLVSKQRCSDQASMFVLLALWIGWLARLLAWSRCIPSLCRVGNSMQHNQAGVLTCNKMLIMLVHG